jgi:hypothetical protein
MRRRMARQRRKWPRSWTRGGTAGFQGAATVRVTTATAAARPSKGCGGGCGRGGFVGFQWYVGGAGDHDHGHGSDASIQGCGRVPAVSSCVEVGGRSRRAGSCCCCQVQVLDPGPALYVNPILTISNVINLVGLKKSCS